MDIGAEWLHTTRDAKVLQELLLIDKDREHVESTFIPEQVIEYEPQTYGYYNRWLGGLRRFDALKYTYKEHKFKTTTWSQYVDKYLFSYVKDRLEVNAVVAAIDYSKEYKGVKVTLTNSNEYTCAKVICTTPVSVLKRGDIEFIPRLPKSKQGALDKTVMKPGFKVAIEFKERFYDTDMFYDFTFLESLFWMAYDIASDRVYFDGVSGKGTDRHVLGIYCYGAWAEEWSKLDNDGIFQAAMKKLDLMYDGKATANYVHHMVQNWTKEPYIWGGFSSMWYGGLTEKEFGRTPLDDKVFFAGEMVTNGYGPTVHGTSLYGRRAALNAIGKPYTW